jgi:hypothetical protein
MRRDSVRQEVQASASGLNAKAVGVHGKPLFSNAFKFSVVYFLDFLFMLFLAYIIYIGLGISPCRSPPAPHPAYIQNFIVHIVSPLAFKDPCNILYEV